MDRHKIKIILILIVIVALATFLRLFELAKSPPSLNWDEASIGYNAYSLWQTGRDQYGIRLPLSLKAFDNYQAALYAYLTAPIVGIFGLNEFNVRLVSAVSGILSVLLIYFVGKKISGRSDVGLIAAFLLAIEPYAIFFSHGAWDASLSLPLFLLAFLFLLEEYWTLAVLICGINTLAYHSGKVYFGLVIIYVLIIALQKKLPRKLLVRIGLIFGAVTVMTFVSGGAARLSYTVITRLWNSQTSFYEKVADVTNHYVSYYNPANLFVRESTEPSQRVPGWSVFYPLEFVGWIVGIYWLFKNYRKQKLLLASFFLLSVPAVITINWFNAERVLPLWAINTILIAIGFESIFWRTKTDWKKYSAMIIFVGYFLIITAWFYLKFIWVLPYQQFGDWQWGFREIAASIQAKWEKADHVIIDTAQGQPHIFTLLYLKYPPEQYQKEVNLQKPPNFGKFEFRKINWAKDSLMPNTILVGDFFSIPNEVNYTPISDPAGFVQYRVIETDKCVSGYNLCRGEKKK